MDDVSDEICRRVYTAVQLVPSGQVATYGDIAMVTAIDDPRTIGYALNRLPKGHAHSVPWQRIVNRDGGISTPQGARQRELLEKEGIEFDCRGHIPLARFRWDGPDEAQVAEQGVRSLPPRSPESEQLSLF